MARPVPSLTPHGGGPQAPESPSTIDTVNTFPVARYRFEFQVTRPLRLPEYAGSALRGAFGHALRQLACMTRQRECRGCPLTGGCPYPAIFAPMPPATHALQKFSEIPVPQLIEAPPWGARMLAEGASLSFHHVLVGRARQELPLIILAWRRAFARGVGAGDGTADLVRVLHCVEGTELEIHRPAIGTITDHVPEVNLRAAPGTHLTGATLHFQTPLRLQQNGQALPPDRLHGRALLMALVRRANLLAEFHGDGPLVHDFSALREAATGIHEHKRLAWREWKRYSSRQRQEMRLGGVIGDWRLEGNLTPFAMFLQLGTWLHVGKETTFGLGRYTLEVSTWGDIPDARRKNWDAGSQHVDITVLT